MSPCPSGVLVVDKPAGMTSHDVVAKVRRVSGERRIGHAGTLDPLATGVLPLVIGAATRLVRFLPGDPKVYDVTLRLGLETETGDIEGKTVREVPVGDLDADRLARTLAELTGPFAQVPPMYSAKKVAGERLYRSARAGRVVARASEMVTVHALKLLERAGDRLRLEVACGPGTYVRSLAVELGRRLGTAATVEELRRLRSGAFAAEAAVPLALLVDAGAVRSHLVPLDSVPLNIGVRILVAAEERAFQAGRPLDARDEDGPPLAAVRTPDGRLLGVAERAPGGRFLPRVVLARDESLSGSRN